MLSIIHRTIALFLVGLTGSMLFVIAAYLHPPVPMRTIAFDTDEGTFINVDVSPDGSTLVFDLLGDLYTLPIAGGEARPLLSGRAWDQAPRFSPDGNTIAFISDRGEFDNLWVIDRQGRTPRQVSRIQSIRRNEWVTGAPAWSHDGLRIAFGFHHVNSRLRVVPSLGSDAQWLEPDFPLSSDPQLRSMQVAVTSATFTPDGRAVFFSETRAMLGSVENEKLNAGVRARIVIYRLDLQTMRRDLITDVYPGLDEFKPQVSRSGRLLAYARRYPDGRTELRVRDLQKGDDRMLIPLQDVDEPYRWADRGDEMPAYNFTPDAQNVVIAFGGKIHRVAVANGKDEVIPFRVRVVREVPQLIRPSFRINDGPVEVRAVRSPTVSRDGRRLVFSAVGYLWATDLPGGRTRRLTDRDSFEYMPALSPDGQSVAYVEFERTQRAVGNGRLMVVGLGEDRPRPILTDVATYYLPTWSADGRRLAVIREAGKSGKATAEFGWVDIDGKAFHRVAAAQGGSLENHSRLVSFSADGQRLLFSWPESRRVGIWGEFDQKIILASANLDGSNRQEIAVAGKDVRGILPSPDLKRAVLIGWDEDAWLATLPTDLSQPARLSILEGASQRISTDGALYPAWQDSQTLTYGFANQIYRYRLGEAFGSLLHTVKLRVPRREGDGVIAFRNARLITVSGATVAGLVIEHGTLVFRGRRIVAVGTVEDVKIPGEAKVIDASGLTIMPGLIDVHYHSMDGSNDVKLTPAPDGEPGDPSAIAYGVTTGWEALGGPNDGALALSELREAGRVAGPRWLFAIRQIGEPFEKTTRYEVARSLALRRRAMGVLVLKEYDTPERQQAQWFGEVARELGLGIASHTEGLSHLLKRVADGYTGVDHAGLAVPFYRDVQQFMAQTGTIYTPNITVADGTSSDSQDSDRTFFAEIRQRGEADRAKFERYAPPGYLDRLGSDLPVIPYQRLRVAKVARAMAALMRAGGKVAIGAHNVPGALTHWEMWALQRGGVTTGEAIRAATMIGAEKIGIDRDVGSLEVGKLADFLVLRANPLEKIENSLALKWTVADGVVYDSETLQIVWPAQLAVANSSH